MTSAVLVLGLTSFIASNPGFIAWLIGGLVTALAGLLVGYYGFIGHRISKLEEAEKKLEARISESERTLEAYKEHVGAGDKELHEMSERINAHMDKEEKEVWGGMRDLAKQLSSIQVENAQAHALIGERLATVETKLPNGEISKVVQLLSELVDDQNRRYHEAPRDEHTRTRPKRK